MNRLLFTLDKHATSLHAHGKDKKNVVRENDKIQLGHGNGGRSSQELIRTVFANKFSNKILNQMEDSAEIKINNFKLAFTTDSYVVDPIEFPGGDIGKIAVCGTVNDLAAKGARPLAISAAFIIEEGFQIRALKKIVESMKKAADEAKVQIVAGDTKVVEAKHADKIFITTSGIGIIEKNINLSAKNIRPGDLVILSGYLAEHGIAVMNARNNLGLDGDIKSDCAPLNGLVELILSSSKNVHAIRDITRGGLATILNEVSQSCGFGIEIDEKSIPLSPQVYGACQILGIDPLYVANEGKIVVFVEESDAQAVLSSMRKNKYGRNAVVIGRVVRGRPLVTLKTTIGGWRLVMTMESEQLPRIC